MGMPVTTPMAKAKPKIFPQNRADFSAYPWDDIPRLFQEKATPRLDALVNALTSEPGEPVERAT